MTDKPRVSIERGVVFDRIGDRELKCDVYTPPGATGSMPGVLLLHGGGWRAGDRAQLGAYGIQLGLAGFVCVSSSYRLVGDTPLPAQIHDTKAAIRWMRANAARLGIDQSKLAILGASAGAHLALLAAGTPGHSTLEGHGAHGEVDSRVAAVVAIFAPTVLAPRGANLRYSRR